MIGYNIEIDEENRSIRLVPVGTEVPGFLLQWRYGGIEAFIVCDGAHKLIANLRERQFGASIDMIRELISQAVDIFMADTTWRMGT